MKSHEKEEEKREEGTKEKPMTIEAGVVKFAWINWDSYIIFAQYIPSWVLLLKGRADLSKVCLYVEDEWGNFCQLLQL